MKNYQSYIEDIIGDLVVNYEADRVIVVGHYRFANMGILVFMQDTRTLFTIEFDFQNTVRMYFNGASPGPRSDDVFWWDIGKQSDDTEIDRFLTSINLRLALLVES